MKTPQRFSRSLLLWLTVGLIALALAGLALRAPAEPKATSAAKPALTVTTTMPEAADWPQAIWSSGGIAAWQEAIVGSEIGEVRLIELNAAIGDRVRKGQTLARLQSDSLQAEREQTRASLAEAEANFAEAQANADRVRRIEASGAMSSQQMAQYLTAELTARARADVLRARLKADDLRLSKTLILAPDDGTISARTATLGSVMQAGQELFRLIRQDRLEWRAELPAADLQRVKPGMTVRLTTASKSAVIGRVRMVSPALDPQTRNGFVYVDLPVPAAGASAGMFASGEIETGHAEVMTLPQSAVLLRDGYSYVFRIDPESRVIQTKIEVGMRVGERIAVSGLDPRVAVVASGVGFLSDGDRVRVNAAPGK